MQLIRAIINKLARALAPTTIIVWFIIVGPLSVGVLFVAAYAIVMSNFVLLKVLIALLLFLPALVLLWGCHIWIKGSREGWIKHEMIESSASWWSVRKGYRILYQAFFS